MKFLSLATMFCCSCATLTGMSTVTNTTRNGITVVNFETTYHLSNIDYVYQEVVKNTVKMYGGNKEMLLEAQKNINIEFVPFPFGVAEVSGGGISPKAGETHGNNIKVALRKMKKFKRDPMESDFDVWIISEDELLCNVAHEFTHFVANHIDNKSFELGQDHKQPFFGDESITNKVCRSVQ